MRKSQIAGLAHEAMSSALITCKKVQHHNSDISFLASTVNIKAEALSELLPPPRIAALYLDDLSMRCWLQDFQGETHEKVSVDLKTFHSTFHQVLWKSIHLFSVTVYPAPSVAGVPEPRQNVAYFLYFNMHTSKHRKMSPFYSWGNERKLFHCHSLSPKIVLFIPLTLFSLQTHPFQILSPSSLHPLAHFRQISVPKHFLTSEILLKVCNLELDRFPCPLLSTVWISGILSCLSVQTGFCAALFCLYLRRVYVFVLRFISLDDVFILLVKHFVTRSVKSAVKINAMYSLTHAI